MKRARVNEMLSASLLSVELTKMLADSVDELQLSRQLKQNSDAFPDNSRDNRNPEAEGPERF